MIRPLLIFLLGIPVTLLGLPLVALGLLFRRTYPETKTPFTQFPGEWELVRLPSWLPFWDNKYDGALGDKRGWWSNKVERDWGKSCRDFFCMWWWLAVRNPANDWSRTTTSIDISKCTVRKISGNCDLPSEDFGTREWVHLRAYHENGTAYDRYFVYWHLFKNIAFMADIGWKFKLSHNGMSPDAPDKDKLRGSVFTVWWVEE